MIGRIVKVLGNRNMLVLCNDDEQRICRIRGKIAQKIWIYLGDLVLISLRTFQEEGRKRGDILARYAPEQISILKREGCFNERLFAPIELLVMDAETAAEAAAFYDSSDEETE